MILNKICRKCKVTKPLEEFYKDKRLGRGYQSACKICEKGAQRNRNKNPQRQEYLKEYTKKWYYKNKETHQNCRLKRVYGITLEQKNLMAKDQDYKCKICKEVTMDWHIDHCHKTGSVRGLLCRKCNNGLGCFEDDVTKLVSAIEYLNGNRRVV